MQFTQIQPFKSPLLENSDSLTELRSQDGVELNELAPIEENQAGETWYTCNRTKFFRHNKKAYRLIDGEGWKQVADPRGELPDYSRAKVFKNKEKSVTQHYNRLRRMKQRKAIARDTIKHQLASHS